ncbi:hypothetical protein TNCV_1692711 [Trichonephila clavipes]|nr:hypothetical protein TNCV_1692711 [Trichonephila clavipes]
MRRLSCLSAIVKENCHLDMSPLSFQEILHSPNCAFQWHPLLLFPASFWRRIPVWAFSPNAAVQTFIRILRLACYASFKNVSEAKL